MLAQRVPEWHGRSGEADGQCTVAMTIAVARDRLFMKGGERIGKENL